jgi:glycosyltransferase involved in cell wall biosynthesis
MAIKICDLELSKPLTTLEIESPYLAVWLLVRWFGRPIGYVKLPVKQNRIELDALKKGLIEQIAWNLDAQLTALLLSQGGLQSGNLEQFRVVLPQLQAEPLPESAPKITVAVCTRDRPESLRRCLESLAKLDYPNFEVLVIDNAPKTADTAQLVQHWSEADPFYSQLRYVLEFRPGVSWGRNRAIEEATGEIIAYADDDVVVDPGWLRAIAQNFADPLVGCVTGLIVPLELETQAQELFEKYGGFGRGFVRKYCHFTSQAHWLYPLGTGIFGTGANTAYRRAMFNCIGGFNPTFGPGTPTAGSEDHELFFRLLKRGYALVYEPKALLRHQHRRDLEGLEMQLYNFGRGELAYMTHLFLKYPDERRRVLGLVGWWFGQHGLRRMWRETRHPTGFPRRLILAEMQGSLSGPLAYFQARRQARRIAAGQYDLGKIASHWKEGEQVSSHAN